MIFAEWSRFSKFIDNNSDISSDTKILINACKKAFPLIIDQNFDISPVADCTKITNSLYLLIQAISIVLKKKPIVIIDEYDVPLEKSRGKYYESMVKFVSKLFSTTFKDNNYLEKGFLTGCLRVSRESIFTGFNNLSVYDCTDEIFSEFFGYTNDEVRKMLEYYGLSDKFNIIKEWYDGYEIGDAEIYNPYSVNSYLRNLLKNINAQPIKAWLNTSGNSFLNEFVDYLPADEIEDLKSLIEGNSITKVINTSLNYGDLSKQNSKNLWSMLYFTGYLTKDGEPTEDDEFTLRIPNKEVTKCFNEKIVSYFEKDSSCYINHALNLVNALKEGKPNKSKTILNDLLPKYLVLRDVSMDKEYVYHSFLLGIFACTNMRVESQKEAGNGYSDIALILDHEDLNETTVIILELKKANSEDAMDKLCDDAIKQCREKRYFDKYIYDSPVKKIMMYGVAFYNRQCLVHYEDF